VVHLDHARLRSYLRIHILDSARGVVVKDIWIFLFSVFGVCIIMGCAFMFSSADRWNTDNQGLTVEETVRRATICRSGGMQPQTMVNVFTSQVIDVRCITYH
jgi:hypothetical protein